MTASFQRLNLNKVIRTEIRVFNRSLPAFQVCGCMGLVLAIVLARSLVRYVGLSPSVMALILAIAVPTFLALVMVTKIITGEERIIYYHHEIAVMVAAAALLWAASQPMLPYLDITILGIGTFLACGRIGCLMVGCCHGGPHPWGVSYTREHAAAGFADYFVGVPLFPIQLVESLWVAGVVVVGVLLILSGEAAGSAMAWYVVAYDLGRFFFEFMRGDAARPYLWGFSQPQWISVVLMIAVVSLEQCGTLPLTGWHVLAAAILLAAMLVTATRRRLQRIPKHRLLHPCHVREFASLVCAITDSSSEVSEPFRWKVFPGQHSKPGLIRIGATSMGIRVSAGKIMQRSTASQRHYTLSCCGPDMSEEMARLLAGLVGQLTHQGRDCRLIKGDSGVFHALFAADTQQMAGSTRSNKVVGSNLAQSHQTAPFGGHLR